MIGYVGWVQLYGIVIIYLYSIIYKCRNNAVYLIGWHLSAAKYYLHSAGEEETLVVSKFVVGWYYIIVY